MIRRATAADAPAIAALHLNSFHHAYEDIVPHEVLAGITVEERLEKWGRWLGPDALGPTFVAEVTGRIYGFCGLEGSLLRNLHVEPAAQGAGLGSALLQHGEDSLRSTGFPLAELRVFVANGLARAFYEKHGWTTDGAIAQDHSDWAPALRYTKQL